MRPYREIKLTKNAVALVDEEDFDILSRYKWSLGFNGYPQRGTWDGEKSTPRSMHRDILESIDGKYIDHINGDKLDNRRHNLRLCSTSQNGANAKISVRNKTGFKGVDYRVDLKKYRARVGKNNAGFYKTAKEAALAYDSLARKVYGDFAKTNKELGLI